MVMPVLQCALVLRWSTRPDRCPTFADVQHDWEEDQITGDDGRSFLERLVDALDS